MKVKDSIDLRDDIIDALQAEVHEAKSKNLAVTMNLRDLKGMIWSCQRIQSAATEREAKRELEYLQGKLLVIAFKNSVIDYTDKEEE